MVLTEEQQRQISEAVRQAEERTSGEIVPMVVSRSDDYPGARWRVAIAFALLSAFSLYFAFPALAPEIYLWVQFPALAIGYFLGSLTGVQRFFLSKPKMTEEVYQRALQAFHLQGITSTRGRTGILIMVSILEHQAVLLADSGINSKVDPKTWETVVSQLLRRIREGSLADGLCETVTECGRILGEKFPRSPDDANELPNGVIIKN